MIPFAGNKV